MLGTMVRSRKKPEESLEDNIRKEKVIRLKNLPHEHCYSSFASASSKTYDTSRGGTLCQGSFVV